jgi:NAD(P)H-dependent FMN reductase
MKIALVLGTARENNSSKKIFELSKEYLLEKDDIEVIPVDVTDYLFGKTITLNDNAEAIGPWKDIVEESDAVVFVVPEYNHSYPGELKILIDSLYNEYKEKVAGIISTSMGPYAGVRVVEELKNVLHTVNFKVALKAVNIPNVQEDFSDERIEKIQEHIDGMLEDLKNII